MSKYYREVLGEGSNFVHDSTILLERIVEQFFLELGGHVGPVQVPKERPRVHLYDDILSRQWYTRGRVSLV